MTMEDPRGGASDTLDGEAARKRLLAFLVLTVFVSVSLVGWVFFSRAGIERREADARELWLRMDFFLRTAAYLLPRGETGQLKYIAEKEVSRPGVAYIIVRDETGSVVTRAVERGWEPSLEKAERARVELGQVKVFEDTKTDAGIPYSRFTLPLSPGSALPSEQPRDTVAGDAVETPTGWIQAGFPREPMAERWRKTRKTIGLLSALMVVLATAVTLLAGRFLLKSMAHPPAEPAAVPPAAAEAGLPDVGVALGLGPAGVPAPAGSDGNVSVTHAMPVEVEWALADEVERRVDERTRELTEAKQRLEMAYHELQETDKMKDAFLSSVSHELRTPLTSIRSFSEILLHYDDTDQETSKEFLSIINSESERLTRLINDILDLSRIEAGRMVWHDDLLSLEDVVQDMLKVNQGVLKRKNLTLDHQIQEHLPLAFADRDRIAQVFTNLIGNAIKFSNEGDTIVVGVESFEGKRFGEPVGWLRAWVGDEGIGIDPKDHKTIFDKFSQVTEDTLAERPKGTGLGLPICKEIIAHYGGNIWVESRKGEGSTFYFTLPAAVAQKEEEEPLPEQPPVDEAVATGKTILVVDDNLNMRRLLRYHFTSRGYNVREACSGKEALEQVKAGPVDLMTLDLMMPVMSGYDVLGMLRKDPVTRDIPILVVSVVENKEKGLLLGANDYLNKPFDENDLVSKVKSLLGREKRTVFVVDDDKNFRDVLRMQLEAMDYRVWMAKDGEEAVQILETRVPDLVILDVLMPKMNGYEVLSWIRQNPTTQDLPVVIITAHSLTGERVNLMALGVEAYVQKADGLERLFKRVDKILMPEEEGEAPETEPPPEK